MAKQDSTRSRAINISRAPPPARSRAGAPPRRRRSLLTTMRDAEACGALLERRDASKPRRLPFVNGTRALASLWIVCQHFLPHSQEGVLVKALWRSTAAVDVPSGDAR